MSPNFFQGNLEELFLEDYTLIDVRAPKEFKEGSFPGAINLPLLNDEERHLVGICYKEKGQEEAIKLGNELVSGEIKEARIQAWIDTVNQQPNKTVLYCFRGGLRSQTSQAWLNERGIDIPIIQGGQKKLRNFLLETLERLTAKLNFVILTGLTGSAKTRVIEEYIEKGLYPTIDLEGLANHKGSAFGSMGEQPSQIDFENSLSVALLKLESETRPILLEDESLRIGVRMIPKSLFEKMSLSPIIQLDSSLEERAKWIRVSYVEEKWNDLKNTPDRDTKFYHFFYDPLNRIKPKLSNEIFEEIKTLLGESIKTGDNKIHEEWIALLLRHYYDPLYLKHIRRNQGRIFAHSLHENLLQVLKAFSL